MAAAVPIASAPAPGHPSAGSSDVRLRQQARAVASDFEAVFLASMLETMFAGVDAQPPFGGGSSEKTYRSLLVTEYAKAIAQRGGLGIADHVYREILRAQEGREP